VLDPRPNLVYKTLFLQNCNVSIITALNAHRDKINKFGSRSLSQTWALHSSTSIQRTSGIQVMVSADASGNKKSKAALMDPLRSNDNIAMGLQEKLEKLPHGTTEIPSRKVVTLP